jgi:hypothetical protein
MRYADRARDAMSRRYPGQRGKMGLQGPHLDARLAAMTPRRWLWFVAAAVAVVVALGIAYAANEFVDPQGGQQHWSDVVNGTNPT